MARPIYVDLDDTLITSKTDRKGNVVEIFPRPGVDAFLGKLSKHGDLFLLTHATTPHVENAFMALGPITNVFSGIISREVMQPVIDQIDYLLTNYNLTDEERAAAYRSLSPLAPRGFVFDDQPVGSLLYMYKTASIGARPSDWIQVPAFTQPGKRDAHLDRAYQEYRSRAAGPHAVLSGRRASVAG